MIYLHSWLVKKKVSFLTLYPCNAIICIKKGKIKIFSVVIRSFCHIFWNTFRRWKTVDSYYKLWITFLEKYSMISIKCWNSNVYKAFYFTHRSVENCVETVQNLWITSGRRRISKATESAGYQQISKTGLR